MEMRKYTNPSVRWGGPPDQPAIVPMNSRAILETHLPWTLLHHLYVTLQRVSD